MAGIDAFGTQWAISEDQGTTYTPVANVTNIDVLNVKADTTDVTSHDSPEGWREFVASLKDGGDLSFDVNYDPAVHGTIFDNIAVDGIMHKITLPDTGAATVEFGAIITGFQAKAPYDDKLSAAITIKVTGKPTITP